MCERDEWLRHVIVRRTNGLCSNLNMATPGRFERPTHSLEGCCSIQLSYGAAIA